MNGTKFEEKEIFMFNLMNQLNKDNSSFAFPWCTVTTALNYMLNKPNYSEPKFLAQNTIRDSKDSMNSMNSMISEVRTALNNLGFSVLDIEVIGRSTVEIKDKDGNRKGYPITLLDGVLPVSDVYQSSKKDFSFRGEFLDDNFKREIYCLSHSDGRFGYNGDLQHLLRLYELSFLWKGDVDALKSVWTKPYGDFKLFLMKFTELHKECFDTLGLDKTFDEVYDRVYDFLKPILPSNKVVIWDGSKWTEV